MEAGTASGCVEGTRCDYGRSCCCNACVTPLTCTCEAGRFGCVAGDLICACSPGCDVFEVATADGCTPCAVAVTAAAARFDALVGVLDRCSVDSQCVLRAGVRCAAPCVAIGASAAETFEHTVSEFESSVCRDLDSVCRVSADPVCPAGVIARCADGHCALGAPCDPAVAAVGAACDDGDPCSEGDACSADHQCVGRPVDCDDGNDCTSDDCSPDGGCAHSQRDGNCALASAACSIGGVCKAGQCTVGPPGFTTNLDGAHAYASAVAVDDTGDLVVVGATGAAPSVGALWRVAPDGATQASTALTGIERAGDVVALAGGDLLIAGEARGASDLDVVVTRVDREGAPRWRQLIAHAGDDLRPELAVGGAARSRWCGSPTTASAWTSR
ncbi:MAG: hypothetical protein U1F43_29750 [Myxococcota bacterium]